MISGVYWWDELFQLPKARTTFSRFLRALSGIRGGVGHDPAPRDTNKRDAHFTCSWPLRVLSTVPFLCLSGSDGYFLFCTYVPRWRELTWGRRSGAWSQQLRG